MSSRTASEVDCSSDKKAPSAQISVDIVLAFLKLDFRALYVEVNIFEKRRQKGSENGEPENRSVFLNSKKTLIFGIS